MDVTFFWKEAGLVSAHFDRVSLHLLPSRPFWKWGFSVEPYDLCMDYFGLGPLFLYIKLNMGD